MEKLLKVTNIETRFSDKANCNYKVVTVEGFKVLGHREIRTLAGGVINLWPAHEAVVDGKATMFKADRGYDDITTGDWIDGEVRSFETTPYVIDGKRVNRYTCIVKGTEDGLVVAAKALRRNGAAPIDPETGLVFKIMGSNVVTPKVEENAPKTDEPEPIIEGEGVKVDPVDETA